MSQIRREVLNTFKKLHRTRQLIFEGDQRALEEGRKQINENFKKNRNATEENDIKEMIKLAKDVETELRTNVIQAVEKEKGLYKLRITKETTRLDNVPFDTEALIERPRGKAEPSGSAYKACCGGSTTCQQLAEAKKNKETSNN